MKSLPIAAAVFIFCASVSTSSRGAAPEIWLGAWGLAPLSLSMTPRGTLDRVGAPNPLAWPSNPTPNAADVNFPNLANVTLRELVRVSVAGSRLRVRFSNEPGVAPMHIGSAHIARAGEDGAIIPGSDHVITFNGQPSVIIPDGSPMLSDPVDMSTTALEKLAISVYSPDNDGARSYGDGFNSVPQYVSQPGDFSGDQKLPGARLGGAYPYVSSIEVVPTVARYAVVTFGDSITESSATAKGEFLGWGDMLADRLATSPNGRRWSMVNSGISGNRLLLNISGQSALARFDRDVLGVPGVRVLILLEGINDISRHLNTIYIGQTGQIPTLDQIISADKQIIARAHAHGIRVIGATLTPYKGFYGYDPDDNLKRKALNQWIRTSGAFDAVVEFESAVKDPADPDRIAPEMAADPIHPNAAGHFAMAKAIDLNLLPESLPLGWPNVTSK